MPIKCCKDCVPPQRFPGCHAKCSKYLEEKAKWEEEKKFIKANKLLRLQIMILMRLLMPVLNVIRGGAENEARTNILV